MADFVLFNIIQSVHSETSESNISHGYNDAGTLKTSELLLTRGTWVDPDTGDPVHIMQDSPAVGGFTYFLTDSGDDANFASFGVQQEVAPTGIEYYDLQQEVAPTGFDSFDIQQEVAESYKPAFNLIQEVVRTNQKAYFFLEQAVYVSGIAGYDIQQQVYHQPELAYFGIQQQVLSSGTVGFNLNQTVNPPSGTYTSEFFDNTQFWTVKVTLAGVDISSLLTDSIEVEAEEGSARVAEVTYYPPAGTIDPYTLIKQTVTIDYIVLNSSGVAQYSSRIFTGLVDTPEFDATLAKITLKCTDGLQYVVDEYTQEQILDFTGAYHSDDIFDTEGVSTWDYLQDIIETVPRSVDLDVYGNLRVTDWLGKSTEDWEFQEAQIEYRTPEVEIAHWRDMINKVDILLDNRFNRLYHRTFTFGWRYPRSLCQYLTVSSELVTKSMLYSAVEGLGWGISTLAAEPLPPNSVWKCIGGAAVPVYGPIPQGAIVLENPYYPDLYTAFSVGIYKRWAQTVTEKYSVSVIAPQTVNELGESVEQISSSIDIDFDVDGYEELDNQETAQGNSENPRNFSTRSCVTTENTDEYSFTNLVDAKQPPDGATVNSLGDWYLDEDSQERYEAAMKVLLAQARVMILKSHRRNYVTFERPFIPIDLINTVYINTTRLQAKGKVSKVIFEIDIEGHLAKTTTTLSISKSTNESVTEQVAPGGYISPIPRVSNTGYWSTIDPVSRTGYYLSTQIGNDIRNAKPFCENKLGFSANLVILADSQAYDPEVSSHELTTYKAQLSNAGGWESRLYPHRLKLEAPGVDQGLRDEAEIEKGQNLNTSVPNELLTISR